MAGMRRTASMRARGRSRPAAVPQTQHPPCGEQSAQLVRSGRCTAQQFTDLTGKKLKLDV